MDRENGIGWTEVDDIELSDDRLAHDDMTDEHYVGCCQTEFHVIEDESSFQELLKFLHRPKE